MVNQPLGTGRSETVLRNRSLQRLAGLGIPMLAVLLVLLAPLTGYPRQERGDQQSGQSATQQDPETGRRSGVLQRLRQRRGNGNPETPPNENLGDRLRDRLGVEPGERLLPGLLDGAMSNPEGVPPASGINSGLPQPPPIASPQIVSSEAIIGTQYNIGHVVFRLLPEDLLRWQSRAIFVTDVQNRILFPAITPSFMDRLTSQVTDQTDTQPRDVNIWFLFTGREPLDVTIHASDRHPVRLTPVPVRRIRQRLVTQNWWRQFHAMLDEQTEASDYPPLVQAYLGSMVQQRIGLPLPILQRQKSEPADPLTATWYLLTGAEDLQVESMRGLMMGTADTGPASLPLPENIPWQSHRFPDLQDPVPVEEIAHVVPQECFYLRFGTWANQIWLKQLMEEHGGDLSRMIRLRGYQSMVGDVFREQLALESSQLDDLFGGTLIADVAVVGLDTFFNDGAAAGIIFQANNGLLKRSMDQKRAEFAKRHQARGVTLQEVSVGDQTGTLLQSPDGKIRSLMVVADNFVMVTTSFALANRFLEAKAGVRTLADSSEFQNARLQMPLSRDDTIFVYLSTAFLENLLSPHYQIELQRRLRSITEIQALQLASWTAEAQGLPSPNGLSDWDQDAIPERIEALQAAGLLPQGFNQRPDGSRLGAMVDLNWDEIDLQQGSGDRPPADDVAPGELELEGGAPDAAPVVDSSPQKPGSLLGSVLGMLGGSGGKEKDKSATPDQDTEVPLEPPANATQDGKSERSAQTSVPLISLENVRENSPVGGLRYGDTHRGVRGWMVPVADMPVEKVTAQEQDWYRQRAQYFADNWGQTDPIMLGIKRYRLEDSRERVVFDGRVVPFGSQKYAWLTDNIGPPTTLRPAKSPDDVIRLEISIAQGALFPSVGAHQLFAAVQRDAQQLSSVDPGEWWTTLKLIQDTPGYIGSWPTAGWLNMLPMLGGQPDAEGFTHSIGRRIWRMQHEGFSVVATTRERLESLRPYLTMVEAENPAQARLEVSDLNDSQLAGWTNALWRQRSWQASVANTRLLHLLMQHFRLSPREARKKAQSLLNARLVCSLDGHYQVKGQPGAAPDSVLEQGPEANADPFGDFWVSDRWPNDSEMAAELWAQEQSPLLKWFRGAMLEVLQEEERFLVHGYLDIHRGVKETASLPGFKMFEGFSFK